MSKHTKHPEAYSGATVEHKDGRKGLVMNVASPDKEDGPVRLNVKAHGDHHPEWSDAEAWHVVNPGRETVPDGAVDLPVKDAL